MGLFSLWLYRRGQTCWKRFFSLHQPFTASAPYLQTFHVLQEKSDLFLFYCMKRPSFVWQSKSKYSGWFFTTALFAHNNYFNMYDNGAVFFLLIFNGTTSTASTSTGACVFGAGTASPGATLALAACRRVWFGNGIELLFDRAQVSHQGIQVHCVSLVQCLCIKQR